MYVVGIPCAGPTTSLPGADNAFCSSRLDGYNRLVAFRSSAKLLSLTDQIFCARSVKVCLRSGLLYCSSGLTSVSTCVKHGLDFAQDLKLVSYLKIPPRTAFAAQIYASVLSCVVQVGVLTWMQGETFRRGHSSVRTELRPLYPQATSKTSAARQKPIALRARARKWCITVL